MTTVKVKFCPSSEPDTLGHIQYVVNHRSRSRRIPTPYRLYPHEWNRQRSTLEWSAETERHQTLSEIHRKIRCDLERIHGIIRELERGGMDFTAETITQEFIHHVTRYSLFNYMQRLIDLLRKNGRIRTSETYTAALSSFRRFREGIDIRLDFLTSDIVEGFAAWHKQQGNCPNTVSFYTRILRAVYNRAVEEGGLTDTRPFRRVYTGVEKTKKRALPLQTIRSIRNLDLSFSPALTHARDIFILSFLLRGMSFVDMAYMRKSDLRNGILTYRRRKTGQKLSVAWTREMQAILDSYPDNDTDFLFPIIRRTDMDCRRAYQYAAAAVNRGLKGIAKRLGLSDTLTFYVARHSWASAAWEKGVPVSVISEGMGHEREETTKIYLSCLASPAIDRANSLIINALK